MSGQRLWYTRRGQVVRGPFPAGLIGRYLLLGRIVDSDEISSDQIHWRPVSEHPSLYPPELKADLTEPGNQERLQMARLREDERGRDRRGEHRVEVGIEPEDLAAGDRRAPEDDRIRHHRDTRNRLAETLLSPRGRQLRLVMAIVGIFLLVTVLAFIITPDQEAQRMHCEQPASAGVSWSGCRKNGESLRQQNLEHANMANAEFNDSVLIDSNLSHSLLEYSQFIRANLSGANLSQAEMKGAVLQSAMLRGCDLSGAKMNWAVLRDANLQGANLRDADLSNADLRGALIDGASLQGARLGNAIWIDGKRCTAQSVTNCTPAEPVDQNS